MPRSAFFGNLDFATIAGNPEFKEASVRSTIINPILNKLGYSVANKNLVEEKVIHIKQGSGKPLPKSADYALKVGDSFVCVIEAKAPQHNIAEDSLIDQAFSYASHREIRSNYFVLCNGLEFVLFKTDLDRSQLLHFYVAEIEQWWDKLCRLLSPDSFQTGIIKTQDEQLKPSKDGFDKELHCKKLLPDEIVKIRREQAKRHHGTHPYFTKQSWDVVQAYIQNYSRPGEVVLDPFGGSGVTAIEALMMHRKAVNVDINPFSIFLTETKICPAKDSELAEAFEEIYSKFVKKEAKTNDEIKSALKKYPRPKPLPLKDGTNVGTADKCFSDKQTADLGLLKSLIMKVENKNVRKALLLMFSSVVHYYNLNSIDGPHGNAGARIMWGHTNDVAEHPTTVEIKKLLKDRYNAVRKAKKEIALSINDDTIRNAKIIRGSATDLSFIENESVDYIYTDPPYGAHFAYLDYSAMYMAWLDLDIDKKDYQLEAIQGGKLKKTKSEYESLIAQSIKEMFRVLKYNRWLSFVFFHKDPEFWHLIIDTAESCGFEFVGAVPQKNANSQWTKRKNPFTTLSGQLIINFHKVRNPKTLLKANFGMDAMKMIDSTIAEIVAENNGATLDEIYRELYSKAMSLGFLDIILKTFPNGDLIPLLKEYKYNDDTEKYTIVKNFKKIVNIWLRIRICLMDYLARCEKESRNVDFTEIYQSVTPLLKNGNTPKDQTVLSVLEDIGEKYGNGYWQLKKSGQKELVM